MIQRKLVEIQTNALWLSATVFVATRELNILLFGLPTEERWAIEFAKEHYLKIANIRDRIERAVAADLITLHDVPSFLREKRDDARKVELVELDAEGFKQSALKPDS